jgi:retron-type reverse transcriptase
MALKLVMEPIFEIDFYPSSYAYRPGRRAQDAITEIHHLTKALSSYEWVVETDVEACFDRLSALPLWRGSSQADAGISACCCSCVRS